jgi:hypothetical protein
VQRGCDLTSVPRKSVLRLLAEHCSDAKEKYRLMLMCSRDGKEAYNKVGRLAPQAGCMAWRTCVGWCSQHVVLYRTQHGSKERQYMPFWAASPLYKAASACLRLRLKRLFLAHGGCLQEILECKPTLLDLLNEFPSCKPPLDALLDALPALPARMYSVACSPMELPEKVGGRSVEELGADTLRTARISGMLAAGAAGQGRGAKAGPQIEQRA